MKRFLIPMLLTVFSNCGEPPLDSANVSPDKINIDMFMSNDSNSDAKPKDHYLIGITFTIYDGKYFQYVRLSLPSTVFFNNEPFYPIENTWDGSVDYFLKVEKSKMLETNRLTYIDSKGTKHERDIQLRGIELVELPASASRQNEVAIKWNGPSVQENEMFDVEVFTTIPEWDPRDSKPRWAKYFNLRDKIGRVAVPLTLESIPNEVQEIGIYACRSYTDPEPLRFTKAGGSIHITTCSFPARIVLE